MQPLVLQEAQRDLDQTATCCIFHPAPMLTRVQKLLEFACVMPSWSTCGCSVAHQSTSWSACPILARFVKDEVFVTCQTRTGNGVKHAEMHVDELLLKSHCKLAAHTVQIDGRHQLQHHALCDYLPAQDRGSLWQQGSLDGPWIPRYLTITRQLGKSCSKGPVAHCCGVLWCCRLLAMLSTSRRTCCSRQPPPMAASRTSLRSSLTV